MREGPSSRPATSILEGNKVPLRRTQVVASMRTGSVADSLLGRYLHMRWNELRGQDALDAQLQLIIETAEIYRDAGYVTAAIQAFEDAKEFAQNIGSSELAADCAREVGELERTLH